MDHIVFFDLETTGLDPQNDFILEVGVLVVNAQTFEEVRRDSWCVAHEVTLSTRIKTRIPTRLLIDSEVVSEMHTVSGLMQDCDAHGISLREVEKQLLELPYERMVLAGYSVHFDLSFVKENMPEFAKRLSHRLVDVSSFRQCFQAWGLPVPEQKKTHRALADCQEALAELQMYRDRICSVRATQ